MKIPLKVTVTITVIVIIAAGLLLAQRRSSSSQTIHITGPQMEFLISTLPPQQQNALANDPEGKRRIIENLKEQLAVYQEAERLGYADRADIKSQVELQENLFLANLYKDRKNEENKAAEAQVSDQDIEEYYKAHPGILEKLISSDERFKRISDDQRAQIRKQYGEVLILADRARKEGYDKEPNSQLQLLVRRADIIGKSYAREIQNKITVTDADIGRYHASHPQEFEEVRARHILISTRAEQPQSDEDDNKPPAKPVDKEASRKKAEEIEKRAKAGEDFAALAKQYSDDPGSKEQGGDLGFFSRGRMVPQFEEASFALKPGEISGIVESPFGFHIIKVEERRNAPLTASTRSEIEQKVKRAKFEERIKEIVARSSVIIDENFQIPNPQSPGQKQEGAPGGGQDPHKHS